MEIRPASIAQVAQARDGRMIEIGDDVGNVAKSLQQIDPGLRLRYSEAGEYFVVYWRPDEWDEGDGQLVLTAQECDQRIVKRVQEIAQPGYDFAAELERLDEQTRTEKEHEWSERVGETGERLAHALRKDRGYDQSRVFIPEGPARSDS